MADTLTLDNPRAVMGGNQPPLGEQLREESLELFSRTSTLIDQAGRAVVRDADTAAKLDAKWTELITPRFGFPDYAALEAELRRRNVV